MDSIHIMSALVCRPTCAAAFVNDGAQSLADCEPQVWTFINSHAQSAGDSFEGCHQIHRTCTETREHGPNLKEDHRYGFLATHSTWILHSGYVKVHVKLPEAVRSDRLWPPVSVPAVPTLQLQCKDRVNS